jgi:hypothetical protein
MNLYDVGDVVRMRATFTNSAGTPVDPSSLTLQYRQHLSDPLSYSTVVYGVGSITRVSTGSYFSDVAVNSGGEWRYRWNGTGENAAAVEEQFKVRWRTVG